MWRWRELTLWFKKKSTPALSQEIVKHCFALMQDKSYTHVVKKGGRVFYKYNVETLKRILAYDRISQQID
jgi:hypothetical protein